jgi:hypothetical protein
MADAARLPKQVPILEVLARPETVGFGSGNPTNLTPASLLFAHTAKAIHS